MIKLKDLKYEFKKIKLELRLYKPTYKLAKINSKIRKAEEELKNAQNNLEQFKNSEILIDLNNLYVLISKDKLLFVVKKLKAIKDNTIIDDYEGIYQGYFIDAFTNNVVCHFKQIINYTDEIFKISIIDNNYKNSTIMPILEYINLNDIINGKISINTLKKNYLKIKRD